MSSIPNYVFNQNSATNARTRQSYTYTNDSEVGENFIITATGGDGAISNTKREEKSWTIYWIAGARGVNVNVYIDNSLYISVAGGLGNPKSVYNSKVVTGRRKTNKYKIGSGWKYENVWGYASGNAKAITRGGSGETRSIALNLKPNSTIKVEFVGNSEIKNTLFNGSFSLQKIPQALPNADYFEAMKNYERKKELDTEKADILANLDNDIRDLENLREFTLTKADDTTELIELETAENLNAFIADIKAQIEALDNIDNADALEAKLFSDIQTKASELKAIKNAKIAEQEALKLEAKKSAFKAQIAQSLESITSQSFKDEILAEIEAKSANELDESYKAELISRIQAQNALEVAEAEREAQELERAQELQNAKDEVKNALLSELDSINDEAFKAQMLEKIENLSDVANKESLKTEITAHITLKKAEIAKAEREAEALALESAKNELREYANAEMASISDNTFKQTILAKIDSLAVSSDKDTLKATIAQDITAQKAKETPPPPISGTTSGMDNLYRDEYLQDLINTTSPYRSWEATIDNMANYMDALELQALCGISKSEAEAVVRSPWWR